MIITISRQFGAGGAEVAKRVADRLQWRVADNEFVERVAARAGLTPDEVAVREERVPNFMERLAWALASASAELAVPTGATMEGLSEPLMVRVTESVVAEIAREGRVVLVGRGAAAILGERERTLHVQVVAPVGIRASGSPGGSACRWTRRRSWSTRSDGRRSKYHKEYYGRDWADPVNYHMVINTGYLGLDGTADLIVREAGRRGWAFRQNGGC